MDDVSRIFDRGGPLAQKMGSGYEVRAQQLFMAISVEEAIRIRRHLVVEAGTGVGKSFAYLIPAILHAVNNDKKVVVSTHTIALQEQLIRKDIPRLAEFLPPFSAVLVKGRSNYISLRRLQFALDQRLTLFDDEELSQITKIEKLLADGTSDGSRASFDFRPTPNLWDSIASDSDNCLGVKCPTYKECFYFSARRDLAKAQILIVNHALFFSDLAVRNSNGGHGILPNYDAVIFDEAHTIEQVASEHFGFRLNSSGLDYQMSRLKGRNRPDKGFLANYGFVNEANLVERVRDEGLRYFEKVWSLLSDDSDRPGYRKLTEPLPGMPVVVTALEELAKSLDDRASQMTTQEAATEMKAIAVRTAGLAAGILHWHRRAFPFRSVYWIEAEVSRKARGYSFSHPDRFAIVAAPLDIGAEFRSRVLDEPVVCVMTSATIAVSDPPDFRFFHERIHFDDNIGDSIQFDSPFDYPNQARLFVYSDMPDPTRERADFQQASTRIVRDRVLANKGRSLVLFTSYESMRSTAAAIREDVEKAKIRLLVQGDGPSPTQMVSQFMKGPPAAIFGTDSFWQGVDIPGDRLTQVIVVKLPFAVPDHPLLEARLDEIRRQGGNPFFDFQLPDAVIKLKQGFGRLIRTASDYGEVHILDPRLVTKPYGRQFLDSLPRCHVEYVEPETPPAQTR